MGKRKAKPCEKCKCDPENCKCKDRLEPYVEEDGFFNLEDYQKRNKDNKDN